MIWFCAIKLLLTPRNHTNFLLDLLSLTWFFRSSNAALIATVIESIRLSAGRPLFFLSNFSKIGGFSTWKILSRLGVLSNLYCLCYSPHSQLDFPPWSQMQNLIDFLHFEASFGQYGLRRKCTGTIKDTLRLLVSLINWRWNGGRVTVEKWFSYLGHACCKILARGGMAILGLLTINYHCEQD